MKKITVFNGDGIGPEIMDQVLRVLDCLNLGLEFERFDVGEGAYRAFGALISDEAYASFEKNKVLLKAPITTPIGRGFRSCNVMLRTRYDLFANIRPVKKLGHLKTPFEQVDLVIFRENTEDLYIGDEEKIDEDTVIARKRITRHCSERIIRQSFEYAAAHHRKKVCCVHKANILKLSDGLFLKVFEEIAKEYPQIESNHLIIDNACMQMVMHPQQFDVLVMPNLYGDIMSDLASGLIGGLGLVPSANIGKDMAMFEAVHGSAPDIAHQNKANPTALLLSSAMMLDYLHEEKAAMRLRHAIEEVLDKAEVLTCDLNGSSTCSEFSDAVIQVLQK